MNVAVLRLGSLEILAAVALFGVAANRIVPYPRARRVLALRLRLRVGAQETVVEIHEGTPCIIGRAATSGIALRDPESSRSHARLDLDRGVLYLADTQSRNGTFLNGKPVERGGIEVRVGDDIDVGNTRITLTGTQAPPWT